MAPPTTTPASPSDVFAAAVTGDLKSSTKSNAPLDPNTIAKLATGIVAAQPKVETVTAAARATYFRVTYAVLGAATGPIYVEIGHYTEAAAAQDTMRQYLTTFDTDVAAVTKKPDKPLGQVSLQTGASVFWVRDAIWARLEAPPAQAPKLTRPPDASKQAQQAPAKTTTTTTTPTGSGTAPRPGPPAPAPAPAAPNPVLEKILLPLANALDAHLAKFAVEPASQLRPKTAVQTATYRGPRGKEFSFRLVDASGTHAVKPAEPVVGVSTTGGGGGDAAKIVVPTANGSADGVYTFLGRRPGKGRVRLVVARADTLAVEAAEVGVEIV